MKNFFLSVFLSMLFLNVFSQVQYILYGMTYTGGTNNYGVIFSYNINTSTFTKLYDFTGGTQSGALPSGSLYLATDNNLYGSTSYYGANNSGVLFKFNPSNSNYTDLYHFDGNANGGVPTGSLLEYSNGLVYGTTSDGGYGDGIIFSFNFTNSTFTNVHNFNSYMDGSVPYGDLSLAPDGKMYGMTAFGGDNGVGIIFKYDPQNTTNPFTKVFNFNSATTGANPSGSLLEATNGLLYGITCNGGLNSMGTLFKFNPSNSNFTKILDFDNAKGGSASGSLIQASDGMIYGLTSAGGTSNFGVIFQYNPNNDAYNVKHYFNNSEGRQPMGSLTEASDGCLYGLTTYGGANDHGVIFKYNPQNSTYTKLFDFEDAVSGSNPKYTSLVEIRTGTTGFNNLDNNNIFEIFPNPNNGKFNILFANNKQFQETNFNIYNLVGEKIYSSTIKDKNKINIDISSAKKGVYIMKLIEDNNIYVKKIHIY
jgi:uncharacterized repeat protein (TIGR03803 family)